MSVPNQKTIQIKKSSKREKNFFIIQNSNLEVAMYNLKTNSFKLYIYLANNKDGYTFDFYPCDFERIANVSPGTYRDAFCDLMNKGYILKHKNKDNYYMFFEESKKSLPQPQRKDIIQSLSEAEFELEQHNFI